MMISKRENLLGVHLAAFLAKKSYLTDLEKEHFEKLVIQLSDAVNNGHICLPVDQDDINVLQKTPLVSEGETTPLVLFANTLYLHRYFSYESRLASRITQLAMQVDKVSDADQYLHTVFGSSDREDLQKSAAKLAIEKSLAIVSGGPGTGKTSTVVRIIGILIQLLGKEIKIALAAPTGKAALRLHQSILASIKDLPLPTDIKQSMPTNASTLHRLLGTIAYSPKFRYNHGNPMEWDIVIVDEASMVDLALMSKLVDALKPDARLILLGDKDQLASVESGAVLSDLIETLPLNTIVLQKSYRFDKTIKELADAINTNDADKVTALLDSEKYSNIELMETELQHSMLWDRYTSYMENVRSTGQNHDGILKEFNTFKILCALRSGRRGVDAINTRIENYFMDKYGYAGEWYPGKPVMITRNDYTLDLYNGDIGICLKDKDDGQLKIWFENNEGYFKSFLPYRLPEHKQHLQ